MNELTKTDEDALARATNNTLADWAEIKLTLEWHSGFSLFFIFTKSHDSAQPLRCCIDEHFNKTTTQIRHIIPNSGDEAKRSAVRAVFESCTPVYLDLTAFQAQASSMDDCAHILNTLNKRRSQLEKDINNPIFIALPESVAAHVVSWAPDLWSVREKIIVLD